GDRFIVRDQSALRTLGGGIVIDPAPRRQRLSAEKREARLAALESGDRANVLASLLECSPEGVDLDWFGRIFNLDESTLGALVQAGGLAVLGKEPRIGLPRATVDAIKKDVKEALVRFHAESPKALGIEIAALRKECGPQLAAATFAILLRMLADE